MLKNNYPYRPLFFLILSLASSINSGLLAQQLLIKDGANTYTQQDLLTAEPFIIDVTLPLNDEDCNDVEITLNLPLGLSYVSLITTNVFELISSSPTEVIVKNITPLANSQNIQFNLRVSKDGNVCENQNLSLNASIQFKDDNNGNCGQAILTNAVVITPKYNQQYEMDITLKNQADLCIGGYSKYLIKAKKINEFGGFHLFNTKFIASFKGELINVTNFQGVPVSYTVSQNNGCSKTIEWNVGELKINNLDWYYVIVKNDCDCYSSGIQNINFTGSLRGDNPCGTLVQASENLNFPEDSNCCGGNIPISLEYYKAAQGGIDMCAGGCTDYRYSFGYNNADNPFETHGFEIGDVISNDILITGIQCFQNNDPLGNEIQYQFCLELNNSGVENCFTLGSQIQYMHPVKLSDAPNSISNISIPNNATVSKIGFKFLDPIPAWHDTYFSLNVFFRIKPNVTSLDDNIATFKASDPSFENDFVFSHRPLVSCSPEYRLGSRIKNGLINSNYAQYSTSAFPLDIVRLRYSLNNWGEVSSPKAELMVDLPPELEYIGNPTFSTPSSVNTNTTATGPLPSTINISQNANQVVYSNIDIPAYCDNLIHNAVIEFDVKVKPGTLSQALMIPASLASGLSTTNTVFVNEWYQLQARPVKYCPNGEIEEGTCNVVNNEPFTILYEIENVGNVEASDLKILFSDPKINDVSLHNGISRYSEFDLSKLSSPIPHSIEAFNSYSSISYDQADLCSSISNTYSITEPYVQVIEDPNIILSPAEKFQVSVEYKTNPNASLNAKAFADFVFCAKRRDINIEVFGPSDKLQINVVDIDSCPETIADCEEEETFLNRVENAFDFNINGNSLIITTTGLNSLDHWYPLWNDTTVGGQGIANGDGTYTHEFAEDGTYEVCVSVENYQSPLDLSESSRCHCHVICRTIKIESE